MQYEEGERDMVMLQHKFGIEHKDGRKEVRTSTLCDYGDPKGYSAMAWLVGVPCAVAVQQVLDGTISKKVSTLLFSLYFYTLKETIKKLTGYRVSLLPWIWRSALLSSRH